MSDAFWALAPFATLIGVSLMFGYVLKHDVEKPEWRVVEDAADYARCHDVMSRYWTIETDFVAERDGRRYYVYKKVGRAKIGRRDGK